MVPLSVGATGAPVTVMVCVAVLGPLLDAGEVSAVRLKFSVVVPVGTLDAIVQVTFSLAAIPVVLLNVTYDDPTSDTL